MGLLMPRAAPEVAPWGFKYSLLHCVDPDDKSSSEGSDRMKQQFVRVNIDPTERYVLSLPGSAGCRLRAWDSGFGNLTLTGDWIYTGLNVGSIEGACMSGALACWAISGAAQVSPKNIPGYLFLHPNEEKLAAKFAAKKKFSF